MQLKSLFKRLAVVFLLAALGSFLGICCQANEIVVSEQVTEGEFHYDK